MTMGSVECVVVGQANTCDLPAHVGLMELSSYSDYSGTDQHSNVSRRESVDLYREKVGSTDGVHCKS